MEEGLLKVGTGHAKGKLFILRWARGAEREPSSRVSVGEK